MNKGVIALHVELLIKKKKKTLHREFRLNTYHSKLHQPQEHQSALLKRQ